MRRQTTITMVVLLVVLLSAGVFNLLQFRNANNDLTITATPGVVSKIVLPPCQSGQVVFVVSLNRPADKVVSVHYATIDGTAVGGTDFQAANGDIEFSINTRDRLVCITPITFGTTFTLDLSKPVGATLTTPRVVGNLPQK